MSKDVTTLKGFVTIDLWRPVSGILELVDHEEIENLITRVGDQYYGERAAGLGSLGISTCMKLGTDTTAAAKTGDPAAGIGAYISGSNSVFSPSVATSLNGSSRRITYATTWAAGTATNAAITEAVIAITNADATSLAADCISRVTFTAKDKQAADTLTITWHHDLLGA